MFNASKYGPGLIGVGLLWVLANWTSQAGVAKDLTARASAAIPKDILDKAVVTIAGRDATLAGSAFSPTGAEAALAAVAGTTGIRLANAAIKPLEEAKPYGFNALRESGKIILSGNVPDPATRGKLLATAKAAVGTGEVVDQMSYAAGSAAGFDAMAGFAIGGLANLAKGNSSLNGGAYTLAGEAASPAGFEAANAMVKQLPPGMTLAKADIQPSAAQIAAAKAAAEKAEQEAAAKAAAEKAEQEAAAKAAAEKAAQEAAAKAAAEKAAQEAAAKAAAEKAAQEAAAKAAAEKAAQEAAAKAAAEKAAQEAAAKAAVEKAAQEAAAKVAAEKAAQEAAAKAAATAGSSVAVANSAITATAAAQDETTPLDGKGCQSKFNAQLLDETIEFQTGKAEVTPKGASLLAALVKTGKRCPKARIEIAGYTDSVGDADANLALSARRAEAVMAVLVTDGLDASLLSAKGYGAASPVASNDTAEGRAKNRRIEFNVQE